MAKNAKENQLIACRSITARVGEETVTLSLSDPYSLLSNRSRMSKYYHLTAPDGSTYGSDILGELGGYRKVKIYGRLDCSSVIRAPSKGYARHRIFFKG